MKIKIDSYKKVDKGKIIGSFDIRMLVDKYAFYIYGVRMIKSDQGGYFFSPPQREYEENGERKFAPICHFKKEGGGTQAFRDAMNHAIEVYKEGHKTPERKEKPVDPSRSLTPPDKIEPLSTDGDFVDIAKCADEHNIKHDFPF